MLLEVEGLIQILREEGEASLEINSQIKILMEEVIQLDKLVERAFDKKLQKVQQLSH